MAVARVAVVLPVLALAVIAPSGVVACSSNHCVTDDTALLQLPTEETEKTTSTGGSRVLLFWSVSSKKKVMELVKRNVDHLRENFHGRADVFLAHYDDLGKTVWQQHLGEWYAGNVQFSAEAKGYKMQLMRQLLARDGDGMAGLHSDDYPTVTVDDYDWVWALDEDVDFTQTDLTKMLQEAEATGSLIVIPAFTQLDGNVTYALQEPQPECRFRYSPMVEVIFPLIRPKALSLVLTSCDHCLHENTQWGLNLVWCSWTARQLGQPRDTACAILDQTPVRHMSFRSLPGKYKPSTGDINADIKTDFMNKGKVDKADVKLYHKEDFVNIPWTGPSDLLALSCMHEDGTMESLQLEEKVWPSMERHTFHGVLNAH